MLLRESASGEPQGLSLLIPTDGDALHEPLELQVGRLISPDYGLHDIGRQKGEADDAANIPLGHAFFVRDCADRWCLAGKQLVFPFVCAGQRLSPTESQDD